MEISKAERGKKNVAGVVFAFIINVILGAGKFVVGLTSGFLSLTADAVNNLSDAGNNVVSFISAKIAEKPADKEHPFGHERMEYVAGTVVGIVVIMLAFELLVDGIEKIIENFSATYVPEFNVIAVAVLGVSIIAKTVMFVVLRTSGKKYDLSLHRAMSTDSISDVIGTTAILACLIIGFFTKINLDGYVGVVVGVIIFIGGIKVLKDTLNPLLGVAPNADEMEEIRQTVLAFDGVLGVHDLIMHQYGPNKRFVTVHVEIDARMTAMESHELADGIERLFLEKDVEMLVHMDPIVTDDEFANVKKIEVTNSLKTLPDFIDMHDFRVVYGKRNRILFDVVLHFGSRQTTETLAKKLAADVSYEYDYCISIDYR